MMTRRSLFPRRLLRRLRRDEGGALIVIIALTIVPLFLVVGLAIDGSRGFLVRSKLSYALDAAGLAGGRAAAEERSNDIGMFFTANFPDGYLDTTVDGPHVAIDDFDGTITLTARAEVPTTFMRVAGLDSFTVAARSVIERELKGMELVLAMDITGSMRGGGKITDMKDAARELVDILYAGHETLDDFWIGLVPYSATVNIGTEHADWLRDYDPAAFAPSEWKGCVEARHYPGTAFEDFDMTDAPPDVAAFRPYLWATTLEQYPVPDFDEDEPEYLRGDNDWDPDGPRSDLREENGAQNSGTGPNLGCGPAITPTVAEKSAVVAAIDEMQPWHRGGTYSNFGLAWAWRLLSPRWQGLWGDPDMPLSYEEPGMVKVVILLTDGNNQWYDWPAAVPGRGKDEDNRTFDYDNDADYSTYGRPSEGRLGNVGSNLKSDAINDRMAQLCTAMKDAGIILYTITFDLNDAQTKQLFEQCATVPSHYFNSPTGSDLRAAFRAIADQLSNLRIAE